MNPMTQNVVLRHYVSPPTITSSASPSVAENVTLAHSLTANQTVTWSLVGGSDLAKFELSGSTLRFASNVTKDYETPDDSDANNTYVVVVRASNIVGRTTDQTITATVTDVTEAALNGFAPTGAFSASRQLLSAYGGAFYHLTSGAVDTWYDQSGSARDLGQGTGVSRPTIVAGGPNSRDAIDIDGSNDFMTGAALSNYFSISSGYAIASFILDDTSSNQANIYDNDPIWADVTNGNIGVHIKTGNIVCYHFDGSVDVTANAAVSTATAYVIEWRHEGGNLYRRLNMGTESAPVASGNNSSLAGFLIVGRTRTVTSNPMDGRIFEFATWTTPPSSGDRNIIAANFMAHVGAV